MLPSPFTAVYPISANVVVVLGAGAKASRDDTFEVLI